MALSVSAGSSCRSMYVWPNRSTKTAPGPLAEISTTWLSSSQRMRGLSASFIYTTRCGSALISDLS